MTIFADIGKYYAVFGPHNDDKWYKRNQPRIRKSTGLELLTIKVFPAKFSLDMSYFLV